MAVLQRLCLAFTKLLRCAEDEMVTEKIIEDKTYDFFPPLKFTPVSRLAIILIDGEPGNTSAISFVSEKEIFLSTAEKTKD